MRNFNPNIYFLLFFCILVLSACSSGDDIVAEVEIPVVDESYQENVDAYFQLQLGANTILRSSNEELLPGDDPGENKMTTLTFFVIDLDAANNLDWTTVKSVSMPAPTGTSIEFSLRTRAGDKHIFVGANMSFAQITAFMTNEGKYTSSGATYKDVIDEFADINGRGIVMFGQLKLTGGDPVIKITEATSSDPSNPLDTKVELTRVVSKVALTYEASDTPGFVKLAEGMEGSISASNIYFMLNNTSKSIDFISGMNSNHSKFSMEDYLAHNPGNNSFNPLLYFYKNNPTEDFMIYAPSSFVPGEFANDAFETELIQLPFESTSGNPYHTGGLEKYEGKDSEGKHKHYTSFRYCLESTISTSGVASNNVLEMRPGINTRVVVAAKYTPGKVWHTSDPDTELTKQSVETEAEMDGLTVNDPNGKGTFYAVLISANTYEFYTYNAKEYYENNPPTGGVPKFIAYIGGYGYYATFISQPDTDVEKEKDENYNLNRNHYYILSVEKFTPPGVVYPRDAYILVNSETTDWKIGKSTNVTAE